MEIGLIGQFKDFGAIMALAFSAVGSAFGTGVAGMSAIGAWKNNFSQNKAANFMLIAFVGAPLTQTIYGLIVMNKIFEIAGKGQYLWGIGACAGLAIGASAYAQGKCAAVACDAMGETGKGFGNYIIVLGIIETVALFVMAFTLGILGKF
ncbi:MAG: V-type ATP synthase subunit K [Candidatus Omnitrophota bacterium]|nr:V-type ATP synthase subunit K [Candidatus Omnitrophota bacterium]MBU1929267.1 V-type ATP synthase subunit K [Candidatus Omnitrophota bacterium]MBU2035289.1 V-type ATP synthase subunit K [Candidatus Omnitrophota bacterium]MBU2221187.1 V-type ATP synthase subunit K [Candidatus Omnitrophota bacterium]MBU2258051.1 V-type ATP synthase subunit K [Candidatus Omnitrophota bacterium]